MNHPLNPLVSEVTMSWLQSQAQGSRVIDEYTLEIARRVLEQSFDDQPGGFMYEVATAMGASEERALMGASFCQLFYSTASLTDDIQDGDADLYLSDVPFELRINVQSHMIGLFGMRAGELEQLFRINGIVSDVFRVVSLMLCGQRAELARDPWTFDDYIRVAELSAGEQHALYFRISCYAAGRNDIQRWNSFGEKLGRLGQLAVDLRDSDSRITYFSDTDISEIRQKWAREALDAARGLGTTALKAAMVFCGNAFDQRSLKSISGLVLPH